MKQYFIFFLLFLLFPSVLLIETAIYMDPECEQRCVDGRVEDPCIVSIIRSSVFLNSNGFAQRIIVSPNGQVGVSALNAGFRYPNVTNVVSPALVGVFVQSGVTTSRFFNNDTFVALVADTNVFIVNVSTNDIMPNSSVVQEFNSISNLSVVTNGQSIIVHPITEDAIYIADGSRGLLIISISNTSNLMHIGNITDPNQVLDVATAPNQTFIVACVGNIGIGGIRVFNSSVPLNLMEFNSTEGSFFRANDTCVDVDVSSDGTIIGFTGPNTVTLFDAKNISNPTIINSVTLSQGGISDLDFAPTEEGSPKRITIISNNEILVYLLQDNGPPLLTTRYNAEETFRNLPEENYNANQPIPVIDFSVIDIEFSLDRAYFYGALGTAGFAIFCSGNILDQPPIKEDKTGLIIGATLGAFFGFIYLSACILISGFLAYRYVSNLKRRQFLYADNRELEMKKLKIYIEDVEKEKLIGSGQGGNVYKGNWKGANVALKTIKSQDDEEFNNEVKLLCDLDHPYVLRFYGVTKIESILYMVTEFMVLGDMKTWIQSNLDLGTDLLTSLCVQISLGLTFLHSKNIIHRDLAARNVLLSKQEEGIVHAKVADFGLSRIIEKGYYESNSKNIPIRWTAPESIEFHKFTKSSDVWSLGIVFWEIFSRGGVPYAGVNNEMIFEQVKKGLRLEPPSETPDWLKSLMKSCWEEDPLKRPSIDSLSVLLRKKSNFDQQRNDSDYFQKRNDAQKDVGSEVTGASIYFQNPQEISPLPSSSPKTSSFTISSNPDYANIK